MARDDWEDVGHDIEAWFSARDEDKPRVGNMIVGTFIGYIEMSTKFGDKLALIFKTEKPCIAIPAGEDDTEPEEVPKGTCVALFKSGGLRAFESIRIGTRVALKVVGEKDTGKGNPMTVFSVKRDKTKLGSGDFAPAEAEPKPQRERHRTRRVRDDVSYTPPPETYQDDDDIPF